ncbi:molybdopterin molybdotransferase MoeA [Agromyces sp. MMS24-K17]|uniref:molybdopterin molybdotransferase MoeA n=1 Tax=Agromyces sp. MMS24-K17 TaxID=3372850 RepID=UPI003754E37C
MSRSSHSWDAAREVAAALGEACLGEPIELPLAESAGLRLAAEVLAPAPAPAVDVSAMDGWVVAGDPPWRLGPAVPMGAAPGPVLTDGHARPVSTGGAVPSGADAVLRSEDGRVGDDGLLHGVRPNAGRDLRRRGEELAVGDRLARLGDALTPARIALLAVAGIDMVPVRPRPSCAVLVTGDEVIGAGLPGAGRVRDAYTPSVPALVASLGGRVLVADRVGDGAGALERRLRELDGEADVVVTTGGTARGAGDRVRDAVEASGGRLHVSGIDLRPGHPTLLATTGSGTPLVGLPGNPLAAFVAMASFLAPLVRAAAGAPVGAARPVVEAVDVASHPRDTLLVPFRRVDGRIEATRWRGAAMLRGLADADGLLVVGPAGTGVRELALPWAHDRA